MAELTATEMTRMALAEAGHPDLATELRANRADSPMIGLLIRDHPDDVHVISRAAYLAHKRAGTTGWGWRSADELAAHMTRCLEGQQCPRSCSCWTVVDEEADRG